MNANLPERTDTVLLGEKYLNILDEPLRKLGISILMIPSNPCVDFRISSHADISVCHAGGNKIFLAPYLQGSELCKKLNELGFDTDFLQINQMPAYPYDCQLNACSLGKVVIYSEGISSRDMVDFFLNNRHCTAISIKQGYAKCSVCVVSEKAVITSDKPAAVLLREQGIDVLEISPGFIELEGYPYGFIGGSGFKVSKETIAFTGRLDKHPNKAKIMEFLEKHQVKPVFLTEHEIFDVGSIIPVLEN